jgi:hypothetical protein
VSLRGTWKCSVELRFDPAKGGRPERGAPIPVDVVTRLAVAMLPAIH